jgi:hypothetical protein
MSDTLTSSRPRPVLLLAALIAGCDTLATVGKATGVLSGTALAYVTLASALVAVVGGVLVQGVVTPLSAPQDAAGNALVPAAVIAPAVQAAAKAGAHSGASQAVAQATGGEIPVTLGTGLPTTTGEPTLPE